MTHDIHTPTPSLICLLLLMALLAPMASAEVLFVDRFDDSNTASACQLFTGNDCSLRAAIMRANDNGEADEIWLPMEGTYLLTRPGYGDSNGDLDITDDLVIIGWDRNSVIIDASGIPGGDRVFHVHGGGVTFQNVQITGGLGSPAGGSGAGIHNSGRLLLERCDINGNTATYLGGGIYNDWDSSLRANLTVFSNNHAGESGGCIYNRGPTLTIKDSEFLGCIAGARGGGICTIAHEDFFDDIKIQNSTFRGCHVSAVPDAPSGDTFGGGAIHALDLTMYNCTLTENSALTSAGAAILLRGFGYLYNNTLALNESPSGSAIYAGDSSHITLARNIIVGNCWGDVSDLLSLGGNVESPGQSCGFIDPSDQSWVSDVQFGSFDHHGGNTRHLSLLPASPAIDVSTVGFGDDQRGVSRPIDGDGDGSALYDAGAYEFDPAELFRDGFESGETEEWAVVL